MVVPDGFALDRKVWLPSGGSLIIDRTDAEHRKEALATLRPRAVLR